MPQHITGRKSRAWGAAFSRHDRQSAGEARLRAAARSRGRRADGRDDMRRPYGRYGESERATKKSAHHICVAWGRRKTRRGECRAHAMRGNGEEENV